MISTETTVVSTEATVVASIASIVSTEATRAFYITTVVTTKSTVIATEATTVAAEATVVPTKATIVSTEATVAATEATTIATESTVISTEATIATTEAPSYPSPQASTLRTTAGRCGTCLVAPDPSMTPEPGAPLQVLAGRPVLRVAPLRPSVIRRLAVPLDPVVLVSEGQVGALAPAVNSVGGSLSVGGLCPDGLGGEERD